MPFLFMLLLLGVGFSVYLRQRFSIGNRTVIGQRARTVGCLLMLPLPLSFMLLICWLTPMVSEYGSAEALQQAILTDASVLNTSMLIELIAIFGCVSLAIWLMFSANPSNAVTSAGILPTQAMTLRQAAGYSHLTEGQLMMLIRAKALTAQQSVDGYRLEPKVLELWMFMERGVTQYNHHAYAEAIQDFTRALNINHKEADAYAWRGLASLRAGRSSDGLQDIRYALAHTQDIDYRRKLTGWLNAPTTIPHQITRHNPVAERVVSDWLAGVDTVDHDTEHERQPTAETAATGHDSTYIAPPEDDNETLRS